MVLLEVLPFSARGGETMFEQLFQELDYEEILGLTDDLINTENPDKIDLGRMILNYVINKEQFDPNSDSYENLAELIAKIVANNEELLLKALDTTKQQEKKK